ncbi:MAG TPA: aldose epimerase family protein [Allosphingosinicella sp.]|jgi:aldose 1-epimerase
MKRLLGAGLIFAAALPGAANAADARRAPFGTLPDGRAVEAITLTNGRGMRVTVLSHGAILQSVAVPDRAGKIEDVTLGYADMKNYLLAPNYFGATVGRYANRIRDGRFVLDGRGYTLAKNNGPNALHGGVKGFDKRLWTVASVTGGATASVVLRYVSADGEEGYPGALTVTATYSLDEANALTVAYGATTTRPTIVNITNHSFFNLAGEAAQRSIYDEILTIPADATTPVDATLIPTGALRPVAGTPFDFRHPTAIGLRIRDGRDPQIVFGQGYDENFVIARTASDKVRLDARLEDPATGRILDIFSNQPGLQLYTSNFLDGTAVGKSGHSYRQGDGIALEPQIFPDTPNQPAFGSARLNPGQTYRNIVVYRFSTTAP